MNSRKMQGVGVILWSVLLGGCLATPNLAIRDNGLPDQWADLGAEMMTLASQRCIKVTGNESLPKDSWTRGRKLDVGGWQMRRFFTSDSSWVKAEAISQGVIDDVFYDPKSRIFICGSHDWSKYHNTQSIIFFEFGTTSPTLPNSKVHTQQPTQAQLYRSIAVKWDGFPSLMIGKVQLGLGQGPNKFSIQLPVDQANCNGISEITNGSRGIWTLACSNQLTASGTFDALGLGKGSIGRGLDAKGRTVEFTISAD